MNKILKESLDYMDMQGQVDNKLTVDEYVAKIGNDKDIVTLTFCVNSNLAGKDLCNWFERGYNFVLDASVSDGEIDSGKYLVFVEMNRRSTVPERIIELLSDLETLTDIKLKDWVIEVDDETYDANEDILKQAIILNPNVYKREVEKEGELNEMRTLANLNTTELHDKNDKLLKNLKAMAGI